MTNRGLVASNYRILSDEAVVVIGQVSCWRCSGLTTVICLYCQTGFIDGEPAADFTVSNITRVDPDLALQLASWPTFHPGEAGQFANHCENCGQPQLELDLHTQPTGVFFRLRDPCSWNLKIRALRGLVRFCGDEGAEP